MSSVRKASHSFFIAYASLDKSHTALGKSKLRAVQSYCRKVSVAVDYFAEEIHPQSAHRPLWSEILQSVEIGAVRVLILPNLYHAFGGDVHQTLAFLKFLKAHGVRLKTVEEKFDSKRQSPETIMALFKQRCG